MKIKFNEAENTIEIKDGLRNVFLILKILERVWKFYSLNAWYFDKIMEQLAKYRNATELSTVCS